MATYVYARCPACQQENALAVRVGRKSTARHVTCPKCGSGFDYSAWVLRRDAGGTVFHQVDLVRTEEKS